MKPRSRVLIIYTGGTFGMELQGSSTLASPHLKPSVLKKRLAERVPELKELADCDVEVLLNKDSAHVGPAEWHAFAEVIQKRWRAYDGVVLLHGTDTMAYTASALSFLLRPCLKPVVITGAQRPLSALRTDARRNLISAVEIAAHGPRDVVSQVCVFFDSKLFVGNRVRKRSASEFEAFESPQAQPLAVVGTDIRYAAAVARHDLNRVKQGEMVPEFSHGVGLVHVTPGFPSRVIRENLLPGLEALVLVVFPSGTAPTHDPEFVQLLKDARKSKKPVIVVTEGTSDSYGAAAQTKPVSYAAGKQLVSEGGYFAGSMTPECAFVKTAWILGQPRGAEQFSKLWGQNFAGEA